MHACWLTRIGLLARLGDVRRSRRLAKALCALAEHPERAFSAALGEAGRQGAGDLLKRPELGPDDLLSGAYAALAEDCDPAAEWLVAVDTSFFSYSTHRATVGLGKVGDGVHGRGIAVQAALALRPDGQPVGLADFRAWTRGEGSGLPWPAGERESSKWEQALAAIVGRLPGRRLTIITDAEADVHAYLAAPRPAPVNLLVRLCQDRRVVSEESGEAGRLQAQVAAAEVVAQLTVALPGTGQQPARVAELSLRRRAVWIQAPLQQPHGPAVRAWVVLAREEAPEEGVEPLVWWLLSTAPVPDGAAALALVSRYSRRWRIEQVHRVLKETLGAERLQHDTVERLVKALALYYPLAARVLWLRYAAEQDGGRPAAEVFGSDELVVLKNLPCHIRNRRVRGDDESRHADGLANRHRVFIRRAARRCSAR